MSAPATTFSRNRWTVIRGPLEEEQILRAANKIAERNGWMVQLGNQMLTIAASDCASPLAVVYWRRLPPQPPQTVGFQVSPLRCCEVLIQGCAQTEVDPTKDLRVILDSMRLPYTKDEIDCITTAMPLVLQYSTPTPILRDWALLFRDHYLEHSVGFLFGVERAGISPNWIFTLDKGDRTRNRDRVHATFQARGYYRSDLLDNAAIDAPMAFRSQLDNVSKHIDAFIDAAHGAGRRVLAIDDGGLLTLGYGGPKAIRRVDAAIELTVSGIKRIAEAGRLEIPVLNMARSQTKTLLGYLEIADSCLRRLRTLLADRKFIGRSVLLIGYGTLGARLAPALRCLGCRVDVVDNDLIALIEAAEAGYPTHRTVADALRATVPFLVIGATGEIALTHEDVALLPDGVNLAPFATRDFSILLDDPYRQVTTEIPSVGRRISFEDGRSAILLGDGRSMNLFEADSIPNQGYDAYRAGILIAAKRLCADPDSLPGGLQQAPADEAITSSGLFEAYYNRYLAHPMSPSCK